MEYNDEFKIKYNYELLGDEVFYGEDSYDHMMYCGTRREMENVTSREKWNT